MEQRSEGSFILPGADENFLPRIGTADVTALAWVVVTKIPAPCGSPPAAAGWKRFLKGFFSPPGMEAIFFEAIFFLLQSVMVLLGRLDGWFWSVVAILQNGSHSFEGLRLQHPGVPGGLRHFLSTGIVICYRPTTPRR